MTIYKALKPLKPGKPVDVLEKDENDNLVGAWVGYWNFKRGTVALYPNYHNRFAAWPGGIIPSKRRVVSDRMIKTPIQQVQTRATITNPIKSQTDKAMRDLIGQEKIKF